jgi:hypothetical protein
MISRKGSIKDKVLNESDSLNKQKSFIPMSQLDPSPTLNKP